MRKHLRTVAAWTLIATSLVVVALPSAARAAADEPMTPISPARYLDTRPGLPTFDNKDSGLGRLRAEATYTLKVTRGFVPKDVAAVMMNVTAIQPDANGYLTVFPCGTRPNASSVNYVPGRATPNAVLSAVDKDGNVCIYTTAGTDIAVDVNGYVPSSSSPLTVVPARLMDTRPGKETVDGKQLGAGPIAAGDTIHVNVRGRGQVGGAASAAFLNVTAIQPEAAGYLTVFPCGAPRPETSSVNYQAGQVVPNAVLSRIGDDGDICIYSLKTTHVAVDVTGFVPKDQIPSTLTPARLADTRDGKPTVDGLQSGGGITPIGIKVNVKNRAGLPANPAAVMLNVTAIQPTAAGYLTVFSCDNTAPNASSVNYQAGGVWPNAVFAKVDSNGDVCIFTTQPTHIAVDVTGFVPTVPPINWLADYISKDDSSCEAVSTTSTVGGIAYRHSNRCPVINRVRSAAFNLGARFIRLTGFIGMADSSPTGNSARVTLLLNGKQIWQKDRVQFPDRIPIDLNIQGGQTLVMNVEGLDTSGSLNAHVVIVGQLDGAPPDKIIGGPPAVYPDSANLASTHLMGGCSERGSGSVRGKTYVEERYCALSGTATTTAVYNLGRHYKTLHGFAGILDESPYGAVAKVTIIGDGKVLAEKTGVEWGEGAVPFDLDVTGVLRLTISATATEQSAQKWSYLMLNAQLNGAQTGQQMIGPPATPGPPTNLPKQLVSWSLTNFDCDRTDTLVGLDNKTYKDALSCDGQDSIATVYPSSGVFVLGTRYKKVTGTLVLHKTTPQTVLTVTFYRDNVEVPGATVTIRGSETKQFEIDVTDTTQLTVWIEGKKISPYDSWDLGIVDTAVT